MESTQSQSSSQQIDPEELDRLANIIANFFLAADVKKIPLKKPEIAKLVPRAYNRKVSQIIENASLKLQKMFGYKIVELKKKGSYILINELGEDLLLTELIQSTEREKMISGLRTMVLSLIFMNGGVAHEGILRTFLSKFSIDLETNEKFPIYGSISKLITQDFVRQGYIEVNTVRDVDPPFKEYSWGERSDIELDKKKVLGFVCQMYGENVKPEMWIDQYREAYDGNNNKEHQEVVEA